MQQETNPGRVTCQGSSFPGPHPPGPLLVTVRFVVAVAAPVQARLRRLLPFAVLLVTDLALNGYHQFGQGDCIVLYLG